MGKGHSPGHRWGWGKCPLVPRARSQEPVSRVWTGEGSSKRLKEGPREKRWLGLQAQAPQSKGHISQAAEQNPGTRDKVRHEAGSGGGPRAGRVPELPSGILWNGQPPPPSAPSPPWLLRTAIPQIPGVDRGSSPGGPPAVPCRGGGGGLTWCPSFRGRGPASPRAQPASADSRPLSRGGEAQPASRAPSGPWRSGPRPRLSRLPAPFLRAVRGGGGSGGGGDRQAGGCARADTRAADTHVEGGPGGARGSTRAPARLPRSRGHAATAAPTGGTQSRPRPGQARRAAPRRCRSTLTLARARAPRATLAPKHPALLRRAPPRLCRQPDKAPARRPLHHLPETGLCHMSLGTLPNTPTYAHTPTRPRTPGRAGRKPAQLLGPSRLQTHIEGHNRSASPSHVKDPPTGPGPGGLGWRPEQGFCGWGLRARPRDWRRAPPHRAPPSLLCSVSLRPARRSPANRPPPPARLVCAARFPSRLAVARCLKLCVSGPLRVAAPPPPPRGLLGSLARTV